VTVGAPTFIQQIRSTGVSRGVPVLRTAEYPGAFASHTEETLRQNTRELVWPQVVRGLTEGITDAELDRDRQNGRRPVDEVVYTGTFSEVQEFFMANDWSDGLPVVPPTDALVREYLRFTPCDPEEVLGIYALAYRECTVYTVAVNAVMAGCPKELMPICVSLAQALGNGEWRRPLASTHGWTPYAWLNGPLARQLSIDCGQGMISEQMNKALGRFTDLMMLNLGGYYVKENRMGTFGYLMPFVFAEDEAACAGAGWSPYHVRQGYGMNENTVTAASALAWGNNVTPSTDDPERVMSLLAFDITEKQQNGLGNTNPQVDRTVLLTEPVARILAGAYRDPAALEDRLIETARRPLFMRAYANYWANTGSAQADRYTFDEYYQKMLNDPDEGAALTDAPEWLQGVTGGEPLVTMAAMRKGQTAFVVAGDAARNKFMVLPGGGRVTVSILLPDNWDELVAPMGYAPLESFYLAAPADQQQRAAVTAQPTGKAQATARPTAAPDRRTGRSAETRTAAPAAADGQPVTAPSPLTDGDYRLVPSMEQVTKAGRLCRTRGSAVAWPHGADGALRLSVEDGFNALLEALPTGSSLTVRGRAVAGLTLRPQPSGGRSGAAVTALPENVLSAVPLTVEVNLAQSRTAGKATESGATLTLSSRVTRFDLSAADGRGNKAALRALGGDLGTLTGARVTLDPNAPDGAEMKIGIGGNDSVRRYLSIVRKGERVGIKYVTP